MPDETNASLLRVRRNLWYFPTTQAARQAAGEFQLAGLYGRRIEQRRSLVIRDDLCVARVRSSPGGSARIVVRRSLRLFSGDFPEATTGQKHLRFTRPTLH